MVKVFEVGSEYDWESTKPYLQNKKNEKFQSANDSIFKFLRSGRDTLRYIAKAYKSSKRTILMPALCCSCMPEPFYDEGYKVIYYKLTDSLQVDIIDVLNKIQDDSIFLFMNFFAISSLNEEKLKVIIQSKKNILTIEDITHNFLSCELEKSFADITVCSIRKWFSIADGGMLFSKVEIPKLELDEDYFFSELRFKAMQLKSEYLRTGNIEQKISFRKSLVEANNYIDNVKNLVKMTESSEEILKRINLSEIYKLRFKNTTLLFEKLKNIKSIKLLNTDSIKSTLYFPIIVSNQKEVQNKLAKENIYVPVIWPLPKEANGICRVADKIAEHILAIPCDHRYTRQDMEKIVEIVSNIMN